MPLHSDFLPAERLSSQEMLDQAKHLGESPVIEMLDTVPSLVALLNLERQIVFCNSACVAAGGLDRKEDALGMRPGELLHCVHAAETPGGCGTSHACRYCGLAQAVVTGQQGRSHVGECLLQSEDHGRGIAAEYAVTVNPMSQLGTGWVCCSLSDISGDKRREALEHTFFHDILNRASAVQGVSALLADDSIRPEQRAAFLGMLSVSALALVDEIHSHRTLLAAEKGGLVLARAECNSLTALQGATAACRAFGFADGKRIIVLPDAASMPFQSDPTLLGRILLNMLKNALEASSAGMTVTSTCKIVAGSHVRFSIHNDLVMPDCVHAHVFQRSFTTKGSGHGLGTYSIKLLTETYLGGRAWFESAVGRGTTFHTEFPI